MRILVVEDEKKVAAFIKRGLEEEGYVVDTVHDGEEGIRKVQEVEYSLLILDVIMPRKDGICVLCELRQAGLKLPVLMLTGRNATDDIVTGLESGADDYLTKPFVFAELSARVRALVRRVGRDRGAELAIADLRLDPVTRKVWRADKEIILTIKEYGLLEFLMRNAGTVVTRTMIAEKVWKHSFESFTNIIDVYVNYLRKKIDSGFEKKLIHTVRSQGYILKVE
jgi:DNA-binding response OmpR family regulator